MARSEAEGRGGGARRRAVSPAPNTLLPAHLMLAWGGRRAELCGANPSQPSPQPQTQAPAPAPTPAPTPTPSPGRCAVSLGPSGPCRGCPPSRSHSCSRPCSWRTPTWETASRPRGSGQCPRQHSRLCARASSGRPPAPAPASASLNQPRPIGRCVMSSGWPATHRPYVSHIGARLRRAAHRAQRLGAAASGAPGDTAPLMRPTVGGWVA